jgi:hypothetical protein
VLQEANKANKACAQCSAKFIFTCGHPDSYTYWYMALQRLSATPAGEHLWQYTAVHSRVHTAEAAVRAEAKPTMALMMTHMTRYKTQRRFWHITKNPTSRPELQQQCQSSALPLKLLPSTAAGNGCWRLQAPLE